MKSTGVVVRADGRVYMGKFKTQKDATEYEQIVKAARGTGVITGILDYDLEACINKVVNVNADGIDLVFSEELYS